MKRVSIWPASINVLRFAIGESTLDGSTPEKRQKKLQVEGYQRAQ